MFGVEEHVHVLLFNLPGSFMILVLALGVWLAARSSMALASHWPQVLVFWTLAPMVSFTLAKVGWVLLGWQGTNSSLGVAAMDCTTVVLVVGRHLAGLRGSSGELTINMGPCAS